MSKNSDPPADQTGKAADPRDLLGDPVRPYRDPRGRKKFRVNNDLRDQVAILSAAGMDRQDIADAIGCCEKTLRTHFLPELNEGKAAKKAQIIAALFSAAIGGSVPAAKAFLGLSEKADAMPRVPAAPKPGKKEQAEIDAKTAHRESRWGELLNAPLH